MTVKISRVRHVLITSIVFLCIIAVIVAIYNNQIKALRADAGEKVNRVIAKVDIAPGTRITRDMVEVVQVMNSLPKVRTFAYRIGEGDLSSDAVVKDTDKKINNDDKWVEGKVATERIYQGEWVNVDRLKAASDIAASDTRLYSIPLDSGATGGYNVSVEEEVDICVLYSTDTDTIDDYQKLPNNKIIDIVLAKKKIEDIRDESGNSATNNAAVVPGYVCFRLTYDEINKLELAKRQGTLFIGKVGDYYSGAPVETFMSGAVLPTIMPVAE